MESIRPHRGFTLIELMVVLAIITIILAVVFTSQSAFNKTLVLANTAYDVALTFRSAESYGLGSRASGMVLNTGYGLDFQSVTPSSYIFFADTYPPVGICHPVPSGQDPAGPGAQPGDCIYTSGQDVLEQTYKLNNGITLGNFCAQSIAHGWLCANSSGTGSLPFSSGLTKLDVVFSRPNPTPFIGISDPVLGINNLSVGQIPICIVLTSPQGGWKYVSVAVSGQINANALSCPSPP